MEIEFDPEKRILALQQRGLDFADASLVFSATTLDIEDVRADYGEKRVLTVGLLQGRMVIIVWTHRGEKRRIISMRKANAREQERYRQRLGQD